MTINSSARFGPVSIALAVLSLAHVPAHGQTPVFTKTLAKVNGVAVTGPPSSLTNGDTLDWLMTYQFDHDPAKPAQTNIQDRLPTTLQYVAGSLQVPPSWSKQWFNGSSWVAAEPAAATGVGAVAGVSPAGVGETSFFPAPPMMSIFTGSGGDGYRAIPYQSQVYVVNHHCTNRYLKCFDTVAGTTCANFPPSHVPATQGAPFTTTLADECSAADPVVDHQTSGKTNEYLDRVHAKLYFPVFEKSNQLGFLCADLNAHVSCGFFALSSTGVTYRDISGIGAIGGRVYAQLRDGKIGCLDTTGPSPAACASQPYPVLTNYNGDVYDSSSEIIGTKIYSLWQVAAGTQPFSLSCFDTVTNLACPGWAANHPAPSGSNGILYPLLAASGTPKGICAHATAGGTDFTCYDLSTGAVIAPSGSSLPNPANYLPWVQTFGGGFYQNVGFGQSAHYQARVFNGSYNTAAPGAGAIGCYDFAASPPGPCAAPPWPPGSALKGASVTDKHYATIADLERPGCMWSYGDDGRLGSFEAANGSSCATATTLDTTVEPARSYCAGGTVSGWDKLSVTGLALGGGVTATLTLYDGSNPTTLALQANGIPYAQNLPVASFPLILGAGGLGVGYGTGAGQYRSLRIVLSFNGISDVSPWSRTPPPSAEVTWLGDPPQFCFQTKVATCAGQFVTNQATALTTPSSGASLTQVAPTPAFSAVHVLGPDCPSNCLTILDESVLCTTDGSGDYILSFAVTNNSTTPAYHLLLLDLPPPATATPNDVTFVPEGGFLAPGATSQIKTVRIHGAHAGAFTFRYGLFDKNVAQCCAAVPHSLELSTCDCAQVLSDDIGCSSPGSHRYTFTVQDLRHAPPVSYALVTATTPGLLITQSGAPIVPPKTYGQATTETVTLSGPAATPRATVCFMLSVHDASLVQCCSIDRCRTLPRFCDLPPAAAADLDVTLSTGLSAVAPGTTQPGEPRDDHADPNWMVTLPQPGQPAQSVLAPDSDWPWAIPGTAWISRDPDAASVASAAAIRYRRCFCIGAGAREATLDASLWADDRATLLLNGAPIAGPGGHYSATKPLSVHLTGAVGSGGPFRVGNNCLVAVVHESGDTTGLDVFGSVHAAGGACAPP